MRVLFFPTRLCLYCFYLLPAYQLKRFQRLQHACASFVLKKYAKEADLFTLNWLLKCKTGGKRQC